MLLKRIQIGHFSPACFEIQTFNFQYSNHISLLYFTFYLFIYRNFLHNPDGNKSIDFENVKNMTFKSSVQLAECYFCVLNSVGDKGTTFLFKAKNEF